MGLDGCNIVYLCFTFSFLAITSGFAELLSKQKICNDL